MRPSRRAASPRRDRRHRRRQARRGQNLLDRFLRRGGGQDWRERFGRRNACDERQVEGGRPCRRPQAGKSLVQHPHHLSDVVVSIAVVGRRPLGQRLPRFFDDGQPLGGVASQGDVVESLRKFARQERIVTLGLRRQISPGPCRVAVMVGLRPVDNVGRDVHQLERGIVWRRGRGHREHHLILDAGELAVTDERAAILQKYTKERRFGGSIYSRIVACRDRT
ncbi:MAG: hypothetical protein DMF89_18525 [Acidobacteria bacterium]|nr:MAG: hypothetical protein DMF89_18525 [Acidobacteriota bacterium]